MAPTKARRDGTEVKRKETETVNTDNVTATENLYRGPSGAGPDRQGVTRNRGGGLSWDRFNELLRQHHLAPARIVHSIL